MSDRQNASQKSPAVTSRPAAAKPARPAGRLGPAMSSRWWLRHALHVGIGLSVLLHALLLSLNFAQIEGGIKKHEDKGLNVVLVNARHKNAPRDAQALAQANLDGGGDQSDQKHMPSSPLPPQEASRDGDALVERSQRVRELEARQRELLAMAKTSSAQVSAQRQQQSAETPADTKPLETGLDLNAARAIARQEAIVDRMVSDYAARPRKAVIGPRTREYNLALYAEAWSAKIQRVGELNFPREGSNALYGSAQVSVEIKPDGSLGAVQITRPSPNPKINEAALNIVNRAAPYARIPDEVRKEYDVIVIVRTMNFTREQIGLGN